MEQIMSTDVRFPIGQPKLEEKLSPERRQECIATIAATPGQLRDAVEGFTPERFNTPYREGGWTVLQVVHHLPDSHLNAYVRFKLALTEDSPTIKPYDEAAWAELSDSRAVAPEVSLTLLESLHVRWVALLRGMKAGDFARKLMHPERGAMSLDQMLGLYAWHGPHHVAHITGLRKQKGW